jgi:hypothetical protein
MGELATFHGEGVAPSLGRSPARVPPTPGLYARAFDVLGQARGF